MTAELHRATDNLGAANSGKGAKDSSQPPYYLSYDAHDVYTVSMTAQQGALLSEDNTHNRVVDVVVRVGDPKLDNTHGEHRSSAITTVLLPMEDDVKAIQRSLWWATNTGYGKALQTYLQVKTETEVRAKEEDTSPDFSKDPAQAASAQPASAPAIDKEAWAKRLRMLSNIFREYPHVYSNFVMVNVRGETGYFVSSEGAKIVDPHQAARIVVFASTRAADGMDLFRAETYEAKTIDGLPSQNEMEAALHKLGESLESPAHRSCD